MKIDTNTMVSITEANQNFSKVARLVDERINFAVPLYPLTVRQIMHFLGMYSNQLWDFFYSLLSSNGATPKNEHNSPLAARSLF